ncbi:MAG: hypothetical protein WD992_00295 [Candidatus Levyibacteriota bacterium]
MFLTNLLLYITAFAAIWYGAGLIISSVSRFSHKLRLSPFIFSFVFLGLLTSTPEFSVGLQAVAGNDPEIFVGNLLGGIVVIFLLVIPLFAVFANGINLRHELDNKALLSTFGVILAPSVAIMDKKVTTVEGAILIILYLILFYVVQRKKGIFDEKNTDMLNMKAYSYKDMFKILIGIGMLFAASNVIFDKTLYFSAVFNISAFYISLIAVSIGTNIPELSLAVRSAISGKKDVAMGDYLGSAAANTLLFGMFTLLSGGEIITVNNFFITFGFIVGALSLFYLFFHRRNYISRNNGILLFGVYILFVAFQLIN